MSLGKHISRISTASFSFAFWFNRGFHREAVKTTIFQKVGNYHLMTVCQNTVDSTFHVSGCNRTFWKWSILFSAWEPLRCKQFNFILCFVDRAFLNNLVNKSNCLVCRSTCSCIPDIHPHRITSTKCLINTVVSPENGPIIARNM